MTGPVVLVLAAHSGAGASTVAVALSDAAASSGVSTRLIECADPARSGVAAATDTELGEDGSGWRRGRRGGVLVDRLAGSPLNVCDVPPPPRSHLPPGVESVTVLDAGWPVWDLIAADRWLAGLLDTAALVLVCRVTVAGVRQAEQVLAALPFSAPSIAALGPATWPGVVTGTCGPLLRAARDEGRVVTVPLDRQLAVTGLTASPLPRQILVAGRSLARLVLPELGEQSRSQQPIGTSRHGGNR